MKSKNQHINISDFSKHLFWDVNANTLDFSDHKKYIINRVMQYGLYKDWQNILQIYGLNSITNTAKKIRDLDKKSMEFLSLLSDVPREEFVCYTITQSIPKHWDF